ncbi:MAG TPA: CinA family nicotinamide mononucleotide deamidase-related protein [Chitinophagaceae bacterium]|nr:CinA family nicotinamide mononucleotide deamidase-related protein [Chitinophagaceae bacterium]
MHSVNASVITIGDELLIGQTIDTNSAFIARELTRIGISVRRMVTVGDDWQAIRHVLDEESRDADVIIITGGLGPTSDDITKPLLAQYFGGRLVEDEQVLAHIRYLFEHVYRRPGPLLERNRRQAEVPDNCTVLMNTRGTAPGMLFRKEGKMFFSLPGVPYEMQDLLTRQVVPLLKNELPLPIIVQQTLLTVGVGESVLAEKVSDWEARLPNHMKLAYLPHFGTVRLRLTSNGNEKNGLEEEMEARFAELKELVAEWLVADEDITLSQAVAVLLKSKKQTVGTAESCTGGYLAHLLSRDPGSSSNFKGSIVSYDNQVKIDVLGVSPQTLETEGAVSETTVRQMAAGALKRLGTDFVVATSGIMGPDGGTERKAVGLVWIAVGDRAGIEAKEFHFRFDRSRNIEQTSIAALNMLRKRIVSQQRG